MVSPTSPKKSPKSIKSPRSSHAPRTSLAGIGGLPMENDPSNGRHSLAHELAAALMPEPSAGSRLLAEEFGIEYDEGAEGIDETLQENGMPHIPEDDPNGASLGAELGLASSLADELQPSDPELAQDPALVQEDVTFMEAPPSPSTSSRKKPQHQDAMEVLSHDLESTDKFLSHLRSLDSESGSSTSQQPTLERIATDVIRRINDSARDREGQVRELLEYEREFKKLAGEVGGTEALSHLEALDPVESLRDDHQTPIVEKTQRQTLETLVEEGEPTPSPRRQTFDDWETDPNSLHETYDRDDEEERVEDPLESPTKSVFPEAAPPPITGSATTAKTIPQLTHLRTYTSSLVKSLGTVSEQAQVNGAATADAGRKIRALKNKLVNWRAEWDSAEKSRIKIEKWEAGMWDSTENSGATTPTTPTYQARSRRIDAKAFVKDHLAAFELAVADATQKTQAIMAAS